MFGTKIKQFSEYLDNFLFNIRGTGFESRAILGHQGLPESHILPEPSGTRAFQEVCDHMAFEAPVTEEEA